MSTGCPRTEIRIHVDGVPVGKGRPRFARQGAHVRAYTPKKTEDYEALVAVHARQAMAGRQILSDPVEMIVIANMPIPPSWPRWKQAAALDQRISPTTKPDVDNLVKLACDAINGIVYRDDSQVVEIRIRKQYRAAPGLTIYVVGAPGHGAQITKPHSTEAAHA
ncbi:RusA family crossover junction endodeoxyribonuclease [Nitrospirillum amazonense]|uniref:RusA family crossover junction endodeoxyribonuclease n=1 Tax=Nitrospirillum amazonense TaxID=28077 RepID=UPI002DD43313|nr:RusA family crossover junction endodeoxyribonuclease [Nitrospirillum amazonense]MEC4591635.1 RusA family crossover junction endodeoxyribonuclease [Nitrospirillum amazonense]